MLRASAMHSVLLLSLTSASAPYTPAARATDCANRPSWSVACATVVRRDANTCAAMPSELHICSTLQRHKRCDVVGLRARLQSARYAQHSSFSAQYDIVCSQRHALLQAISAQIGLRSAWTCRSLSLQASLFTVGAAVCLEFVHSYAYIYVVCSRRNNSCRSAQVTDSWCCAVNMLLL
jgi:hypothetical protein